MSASSRLSASESPTSMMRLGGGVAGAPAGAATAAWEGGAGWSWGDGSCWAREVSWLGPPWRYFGSGAAPAVATRTTTPVATNADGDTANAQRPRSTPRRIGCSTR